MPQTVITQDLKDASQKSERERIRKPKTKQPIYIVALIFPSLYWLGIFGALAIGAGAGDYINVFNALTQVPKGGLIYMCGFHSYWYKPTV